MSKQMYYSSYRLDGPCGADDSPECFTPLTGADLPVMPAGMMLEITASDPTEARSIQTLWHAIVENARDERYRNMIDQHSKVERELTAEYILRHGYATLSCKQRRIALNALIARQRKLADDMFGEATAVQQQVFYFLGQITAEILRAKEPAA